VGALLSLFLVPAFATSAAAQIMVGNDGRPEVEVDSSVLDRLGNEPTLPDLFLGRAAQPNEAPAAESPIGQAPETGQAPELHRPQHPIALKKPIPREAKSKEMVAARKKPSPPQVAAAITAPEQKASAQPVETPKTAAAPDVSLPVPAPKEPQPASNTDGKSDVKPDDKAEIKTESKVEPQPEPLVAPKPPTAATAAPAGNPAPSPSAATSSQPSSPLPTAGQMATGAMPPAPPPATSVPTPAAAAPVLPAVTVPTLAPAPQEPQEAHLTPAAPVTTPPSAPAPSGGIEPPLTILFETDSARLPDNIRTSLSPLTDRLSGDSALQIQILAYAEGDEENASKARRLSLSRALAVRSVLIDQGVRSTRIEVRALGNKFPEGPADRVDVLLQKR
jgi:outer membrane protein OmpA-like peptidoglycan-associated protein